MTSVQIINLSTILYLLFFNITRIYGEFNRHRTWKASDTTNKRKLHKRYAAI